MMIELPEVLTAEEVRRCREALDRADWQDGRTTAGHLAASVKSNQQLGQDDELGSRLGAFILDRLGRTPRFVAAALPLRVLPPRFNRYAGDGAYGDHVDNAVFTVPSAPVRIRGDLSATLFLSDPDEYEGGELIAREGSSRHSVKLPAGHMVLYSARTVHQVRPVTRGARIASFFWIQSLVREDSRRAILLELDDTIQALTAAGADGATVVRLSGIYHNLLREWAET